MSAATMQYDVKRMVPQWLKRFLILGTPLSGASKPNGSARQQHERGIHVA